MLLDQVVNLWKRTFLFEKNFVKNESYTEEETDKGRSHEPDGDDGYSNDNDSLAGNLLSQKVEDDNEEQTIDPCLEDMMHQKIQADNKEKKIICLDIAASWLAEERESEEEDCIEDDKEQSINPNLGDIMHHKIQAEDKKTIICQNIDMAASLFVEQRESEQVEDCKEVESVANVLSFGGSQTSQEV